MPTFTFNEATRYQAAGREGRGASLPCPRSVDMLWNWIYSGDVHAGLEVGWGLAIRLPASAVKTLDLREGDDVTPRSAGKRVLEIEKSPDAKELLVRLRRFRGRLPKNFKFDRMEANERR